MKKFLVLINKVFLRDGGEGNGIIMVRNDHDFVTEMHYGRFILNFRRTK